MHQLLLPHPINVLMITWSRKFFADLSNVEVYKILQLRNQVFVVEQTSVYQDCDDKDQQSFHLMAWDSNLLVAYSRLLPPGLAFNEPSIGRVLTSPAARRQKFGRELMTRSIDSVYELFGKLPITIGAQLYLKTFYESLGFVKTGDEYLEDGIKHIHMLRNL